MRTAALISILAIVTWLALGSRLVLMVDRYFPGSASAKVTDPLLISADGFVVGERRWPLPETIKLVLDSQQRIMIYADGRGFTFGPVRTRWNDPVKPQYLFVPDHGDVLSFTRDVSRLNWYMPFAFRIIGPVPPERHRYTCNRLRWTKEGGAAIEIDWRDEEGFYPANGWLEDYNFKVAKLSIRPAAAEKAAAAYLSASKKWADTEYRLESRPATAQEYVVAVIYLKDETAGHPGCGKSVVLRIDRSSKKVVGETGFQ